jgi:ABC-type cobalamin/Fe3+-siderophores transport system ATPase subunit
MERETGFYHYSVQKTLWNCVPYMSAALHHKVKPESFDTKSSQNRSTQNQAIIIHQKNDFLLLDEPTNHINFRHIPVIAQALDEYKGAMILVSHVPEFVEQIRIDEVLDLDKKRK